MAYESTMLLALALACILVGVLMDGVLRWRRDAARRKRALENVWKPSEPYQGERVRRRVRRAGGETEETTAVVTHLSINKHGESEDDDDDVGGSAA